MRGPPEPRRLSRIVTKMTKRLLTKEMLGRKTSTQGPSDTRPADVSGRSCVSPCSAGAGGVPRCLHSESA